MVVLKQSVDSIIVVIVYSNEKKISLCQCIPFHTGTFNTVGIYIVKKYKKWKILAF